MKVQITKTLVRLLAASAVLLGANFALAQATPPDIEWDKSFSGTGNDYLNSLQQTSDGGYILGGYSNSGMSDTKTDDSFSFSDYWVVKLDANGAEQWDRTFGGYDYDILQSLQQTSDGGYILGGYSLSGASGNKTNNANFGAADYWVVKLDADGNRQWDQIYGGSGDDQLQSLQQTKDDGYILGGFSNSGVSGNKTNAGFGERDYWVVKLGASGIKQWDRSFGGSGDDWLNSVQQTTDGGYLLGGQSASGVSGNKTNAGFGSYDYWVVKLDADGNKQWDKSFGGADYDDLLCLKKTSDGGCVLGGFFNSGVSGNKTNAGFGYVDYWVVKLDSSGNKQWDKSFGGSGQDGIFSLQQTSDGGYILGGYSDSDVLSGNKTSAGYGAYDYWVVKLDANGDKQWDKAIGGSDYDELHSLQQTSDGGYILGGQPFSGASGNKTSESFGGLDYWVVKLAGVALPPALSITLVNKIVTLSWPTNATGFNLQSVLNLTPPVDWIDSSNTPVPVGTQFTVTNNPPASSQFFRLKKP